jgi:hypothetical protein
MHIKNMRLFNPRVALGILFAFLTGSAGTAFATGYELSGTAGALVTDANQNSGWPTLGNFTVSYSTTPADGEFPSSFGSNVLFPNANWSLDATNTGFIESEGFPGFSSVLESVNVFFTASSNPNSDSTMAVDATFTSNWEVEINLSFPYGYDGVGSFDPNGANSIVITGPPDTLTYAVSSAQNDVPEPVSASMLIVPVAFLAKRRARKDTNL